MDEIKEELDNNNNNNNNNNINNNTRPCTNIATPPEPTSDVLLLVGGFSAHFPANSRRSEVPRPQIVRSRRDLLLSRRDPCGLHSPAHLSM